MRPPKGLILCLNLMIILFLFGCVTQPPGICVKDGVRYCVTDDIVPLQNWDACYRRGLSCMEGRCWDYAIAEFKNAIRQRDIDKREVRTFGMHFLDEYFPHREIGISYYHIGLYDEALRELNISLKQTPSARAKYYINQTRQVYILNTGKDMAMPIITIDSPTDGYLTNKTPLNVSGMVRDDTFVASVSVANNSIFIDLSEPAILIDYPVDIEDGWNIIEINARDITGKDVKKSISVYLDQQGPLVIFTPPLKEGISGEQDKRVTALIYDKSGIEVFRINDRDVPMTGIDQFALIDERITLPSSFEEIRFYTRDPAGNETKGSIPLAPDQAGIRPIRLASASGNPDGPFAKADYGRIFIDIIYPPKSEWVTHSDIFLECEIEATEGIRKIELNQQDITDMDEIKAFQAENRAKITDMLIRQGKDPDRFFNLVDRTLQNKNRFHLNRKISPKEGRTVLELTVVDRLGNKETERLVIKRVHREEEFLSEQRMVMAIIPFDIIDCNYDSEKMDYIYKTINNSFMDYGRFKIVDLEKNSDILDIIDRECRIGRRICADDMIKELGGILNTEGVICGTIRKRRDDNAIEIIANFRDIEIGDSLFSSDVYSLTDRTLDLNTIISGLAMKFSEAFPVRVGNITQKDGIIIHADIGGDQGLFPGMLYNIFVNEKDLVTKAKIREVYDNESKAEIFDRNKSNEITVDYRVRTR